MQQPVQQDFVDNHVSFKEAGRTLGCSYWTIARLVEEYNVPCIRVGATKLASWSHLLAARRAAKSKPLAGTRSS